MPFWADYAGPKKAWGPKRLALKPNVPFFYWDIRSGGSSGEEIIKQHISPHQKRYIFECCLYRQHSPDGPIAFSEVGNPLSHLKKHFAIMNGRIFIFNQVEIRWCGSSRFFWRRSNREESRGTEKGLRRGILLCNSPLQRRINRMIPRNKA